LGAPPNKFAGGVKVGKFQYSNRPCSAVEGHSHFKFIELLVGHDV